MQQCNVHARVHKADIGNYRHKVKNRRDFVQYAW
jgi:hypothetical protein